MPIRDYIKAEPGAIATLSQLDKRTGPTVDLTEQSPEAGAKKLKLVKSVEDARVHLQAGIAAQQAATHKQAVEKSLEVDEKRADSLAKIAHAE